MIEGKTHKSIFIFGWGKQWRYFKCSVRIDCLLDSWVHWHLLSRTKRDGFSPGSGDHINKCKNNSVSMEQRGWVGDPTGVAVSGGMLRVFSKWGTWWWCWLSLMILKSFFKLNCSVILWLKAELWISLLCLTEMNSCALDSWIQPQQSGVMSGASLQPPESRGLCPYLAAYPN